MLKLLIVSDSHKESNDLISLFEKYPDHTKIHLGDYQIDEDILNQYKVIFVKGNCDFSKADKEKVLFLDNKKFFITHGDRYKVKSTYNNIFYKAQELNADYCLFGHTHIKTKFSEENIWFLNPGSFKSERSYIIIENDEIKFKCSR